MSQQSVKFQDTILWHLEIAFIRAVYVSMCLPQGLAFGDSQRHMP